MDKIHEWGKDGAIYGLVKNSDGHYWIGVWGEGADEWLFDRNVDQELARFVDESAFQANQAKRTEALQKGIKLEQDHIQMILDNTQWNHIGDDEIWPRLTDIRNCLKALAEPEDNDE